MLIGLHGHSVAVSYFAGAVHRDRLSRYNQLQQSLGEVRIEAPATNDFRECCRVARRYATQ